MEIDKSLRIAASPERIWTILLDPQAMATCVPGMQSVEIISPDEYAAVMQVKIAFVSAKFKLHTRIVERREPLFLKVEGTGEDASVASSLKQVTELTLTPCDDGSTDLRIQVKVDLLGRMGSFGLSVMKTKADRLWDEFGVNLTKRLGGERADDANVASSAETPALRAGAADMPSSSPSAVVAQTESGQGNPNARQGLWPRLLLAFGIQPAMSNVGKDVIVVEMQRADQTRIRIEWPSNRSEACLQWLRETMR